MDMNLTLGDAVYQFLTLQWFWKWYNKRKRDQSQAFWNLRSEINIINIKMNLHKFPRSKQEIDIHKFRKFVFLSRTNRTLSPLYQPLSNLLYEFEIYESNKSQEQRNKVIENIKSVQRAFLYRYNFDLCLDKERK